MQRDLIKTFVLVLAVGACTRLAVVWAYSAGPQTALELPDEVQYWNMANSLADGHGLRDEHQFQATRMPLYPAYLRLFVRISNGQFFALAVQAVLSALACGFISSLAFQVAPSPHKSIAAILAGLLVALDPFLTYLCRFLLTENFFTATLCGFLAVSWRLSQTRRPTTLLRWLASGLLMALSVYLRPSSIGFIACWCLFVLLRRGLDKVSLMGVCGWWLILVLSLSPWAARNQSVTGKWIWLTTRAGISLYDGVHSAATGASDLADIKRQGPVATVGELQWDQYFRDESLRLIRTEPGRILGLAGRKFIRTWSFWPNAEGYQSKWIKVLAGSWTALILASALYGVWMFRRQVPLIVGLILPAVYFTILHLLFVGSVRYRLPTMPPLEILSALGLLCVLRKIRCEDIQAQSSGDAP